jgi:hypothetical protein
MFGFENYYGEGRLVTDISLHYFGVPLALLMFWVSRGDMDMLMLSGTFATLYLLPYNLLPVVPAIARLRPRSALVAALLSWLPVSANWLGAGGWWLGWLFIGFLWICLVAALVRAARARTSAAMTSAGRAGQRRGLGRCRSREL